MTAVPQPMGARQAFGSAKKKSEKSRLFRRGEAGCAALLQALSVGGARSASPELKKLDAAVSMGKLVKADEAEAIAEHAEALKAPIDTTPYHRYREGRSAGFTPDRTNHMILTRSNADH